jgi:hypothetical protein
MRITLDINDDVLAAGKGIRRQAAQKFGRGDLVAGASGIAAPTARSHTRNGVPLLPVRSGGAPVTPELVNQLRDELP